VKLLRDDYILCIIVNSKVVYIVIQTLFITSTSVSYYTTTELSRSDLLLMSQHVETDVRNEIGHKISEIRSRDVIATTSGSCFRLKRAYPRRNPLINNEDMSQNVETDVRNAIGRKINEIRSRDVIAATSGTLFRSKRAYPRRNPSINNEDMSQNVENGVRNSIGLQLTEIRKKRLFG